VRHTKFHTHTKQAKIIRGEFKKGHLLYFLQKVHKNKYTVIFQCNPLASPHICYFGPWASWCHMWWTFWVMYALYPWPFIICKSASM
jgi:hypothetical protein